MFSYFLNLFLLFFPATGDVTCGGLDGCMYTCTCMGEGGRLGCSLGTCMLVSRTQLEGQRGFKLFCHILKSCLYYYTCYQGNHSAK